MSLAALSGFANGFAGAFSDRKDREERAKQNERMDAMLASYSSMPARTPMGAGGGMGAAPPAGGVGSNTDLFGLIDATEGGGKYDTLYGYANNGGKFDNVDVSKMTLAQLYDFSSPNGEYGQWVAANNGGTVATPMGRHQIVGTTLKDVATRMGLSPDTVFTPGIQDSIATNLAQRRISGAKDPVAKRAALRAEWAGFKNVDDASLDRAIAQFEANGGQLTPRPMGAAPQ